MSYPSHGGSYVVEGKYYNIRIRLSQCCFMRLALCLLVVSLYLYVSLPVAADPIACMIWGCISTSYLPVLVTCLLAWYFVSHDGLY